MFTFNDYKYIGKHGTFEMKDKYRFDKEKANQLLANKQYIELADYLSQYQFNDESKDEEFHNKILQLRDKGRREQAYYQRIPEGEENAIDFANSVFLPNGLKQLQTRTITSSDGRQVLKYSTDNEFRAENPEAANYIDNLRKLGSVGDREATALKLEFNDKKYGLFGIDWLKKDHNDYYDMLDNAGFTEQQLEALGGHVERKEGKIIVEFSKNADCCTRLLNSIPKRIRESNQVKVTGLDEKGEIKGNVSYENQITANGASDFYAYPITDVSVQHANVALIEAMKDTVDRAKRKAKAVEVKHNLDTKIYSSTLFEIQTDRTDILDELYNTGQISWEEYNNRSKEEKGVNIASKLSALNYGDYEIYTDYYNKEEKNGTSEIRHRLEDKDWDDFRNILKGVPASKIHYLGETSGGKVGLHISIDPDALYKHKGNTEKAKYTDKPIQIFIPGFMTEEIEAQMNGDTGLRAIKEWNNMIDYQYKHQKADGSQIGVDENGVVYRYVGDQIYMDNSSDAKEKAIREINEDLIKEEATRLKYRYMNDRGELNVSRYNNVAKQVSIKSVEELFAGVPFEDLDGNKLIERLDATAIDKLFDPELRQRVYLHPEDFQYQVLEKLKHLYELYDYMTIDLVRGNDIYQK